MDCSKFEFLLSEYLDGALARPEANSVASHALQCRPCRAILDELKAALRDCKYDIDLDAPPRLEEALLAIPLSYAPLACSGFEEIITEFLDGYVPAPAYHRFEEHAARCEDCSKLLTDVVYAVAACHSVHTYEEFEAPEALTATLVGIMPERRASLRRAVAGRVTNLVSLLIPRATQGAQWTFATGSALVFATFGLLLFGFSDDGSVAGIYRQAHVKAAEVYSHTAGIYAQKDEMVAELQKVGSDIGEIWDTLGGENQPGSTGESQQKQNSTEAIDKGRNR